VRIAAAFALGRRAHADVLVPGMRLVTSGDVFLAFHPRLRLLRKERFLSVLLDARGRVIREELVSEGTLTSSLAHPREVFGPAIREAACSLLLVHNHPSGDPEPSPDDHEITQRLVAASEIVGIKVQDHVVIGDGAYVSFLERGEIPR
jgi:DNA repair protein RadC